MNKWINNGNKHWKKSNLDPLWTPFAPHFFIIGPILLKFSHNMWNRKRNSFCSWKFFHLGLSFIYIYIYKYIYIYIYKLNSLTFYARMNPWILLGSLKDFLQNVQNIVSIFFFVFYWKRKKTYPPPILPPILGGF